MSILIDKNTRIMTQGITGKTGQFHTRAGIAYANGKNCYVAGVNPSKAGQSFEGVPIFGTVREAKEKTGAKIEVFLLRELNKPNRIWDVIVDPARKIRVGNKLYFGEAEELVAEVIDNTTSRGRTIRFLWDGTDAEFRQMLEILGETPLPKYIKRKPEEDDKERYQTVYAKHEGAVGVSHEGGLLHFFQHRLRIDIELFEVRSVQDDLCVGLAAARAVRGQDAGFDIRRIRLQYIASLQHQLLLAEFALIFWSEADVYRRAVRVRRKAAAKSTARRADGRQRIRHA